MSDQLFGAYIDTEVFTWRINSFKDHMFDGGFLEFQVLIILRILILFLLILHHINVDFVLRFFDILVIDAPPRTDQTLVIFIDPNLWHLIDLARRITLKIAQYLVVLLRLFPLIIVVTNFYNVESEVLFIHVILF